VRRRGAAIAARGRRPQRADQPIEPRLIGEELAQLGL
jgi:hypothetical protein